MGALAAPVPSGPPARCTPSWPRPGRARSCPVPPPAPIPACLLPGPVERVEPVVVGIEPVGVEPVVAIEPVGPLAVEPVAVLARRAVPCRLPDGGRWHPVEVEPCAARSHPARGACQPQCLSCRFGSS